MPAPADATAVPDAAARLMDIGAGRPVGGQPEAQVVHRAGGLIEEHAECVRVPGAYTCAQTQLHISPLSASRVLVPVTRGQGRAAGIRPSGGEARPVETLQEAGLVQVLLAEGPETLGGGPGSA